MLTKEEVQHIAKLARIELTEQEVEKFQKDLSEILDYFDILKSAKTSGVEPMTHSVPLQNVMREDTPQKQSLEVVEELIEMAPEKEKGFVRVKEVFSQGKNK